MALQILSESARDFYILVAMKPKISTDFSNISDVSLTDTHWTTLKSLQHRRTIFRNASKENLQDQIKM
jgi:hypothetical protein